MKKLLFVLMTLESLTAIPAMAGTCSVYVDENFYIANDFLVKKKSDPHYFEKLLHSKGHILAKTIEKADYVISGVRETEENKGILEFPGKGLTNYEKFILMNSVGEKIDEFIVYRDHWTRSAIKHGWHTVQQRRINAPMRGKIKAVKKFIRDLDC